MHSIIPPLSLQWDFVYFEQFLTSFLCVNNATCMWPGGVMWGLEGSPRRQQRQWQPRCNDVWRSDMCSKDIFSRKNHVHFGDCEVKELIPLQTEDKEHQLDKERVHLCFISLCKHKLGRYYYTTAYFSNFICMYSICICKTEIQLLTTFWQHALLCLFQLLVTLCRIRLQHPLTCSYATPTRHTTLTPVRPRWKHAWDGIWKDTQC